MQVIVDSIKLRFHREIVANPSSHAWVLNLYRAGERYPQTVTDYFPAEHAPWRELADDLVRHRRDEERHTSMYAHAIHVMRQPVLELERCDVFNHVIRAHTTASFTIDPRDDADARRLKLANFLAHAHFLEKRIARSLEYHREACAQAGSVDALRVVDAVLRDETRHVSYTIAAAEELLTREERQAVFEHHRHAEARANLDFSQHQVRQFLAAFGTLVSTRSRALYRVCAFFMAEASDYV